jgi:hypothetical protein
MPLQEGALRPEQTTSDPLLEKINGIHNPLRGFLKHVENYMEQRPDRAGQLLHVMSAIVGESLIDGDARPLGSMLSEGMCPEIEIGFVFAQTLDPDPKKKPQFPFRFCVYDTQGHRGPRPAGSHERGLIGTEGEWLVACLENGEVKQVASIFRAARSPGQPVLRLLGKMILGRTGPRYHLQYKSTQKGTRGGRKNIMKDLERETIGSVVSKGIACGKPYKQAVEDAAKAADTGVEAVRKHYAAYQKRQRNA